MSDYVIRKGQLDDIDVIADFNVRHAAEVEDTQLDLETCQAASRAVFEDPTKGTYFVAEHDGCVVACLLSVPEWSDWRNGTVVWIHSVYVVAEHRRRGVYRRLYEHLKHLVMNDPDLKGLRLYVDKRNTRAQMAYRALGMTDEHYALFEWLK